jgi:hypothetical protein
MQRQQHCKYGGVIREQMAKCVEIHSQSAETCGDDVMRARHMRNWYRATENGSTDTHEDDDRPGRPSTPSADVKVAGVAGICKLASDSPRLAL